MSRFCHFGNSPLETGIHVACDMCAITGSDQRAQSKIQYLDISIDKLRGVVSNGP